MYASVFCSGISPRGTRHSPHGIKHIQYYIEGSDPVRLATAGDAGCKAAHRATARRREPGGPAAKHRALPPCRTVAWGCGVGARRGCAARGAGSGAGRAARGAVWREHGGSVATGLKTRDSSENGFSLTFFLVAARIGCVFGVETVSGRAFRSGFPCFFIILLRFVFSANGVTRHGYQHEFRERA